MQVRNIEYCCQIDKLPMPLDELIYRIKNMTSYIDEYALIVHDRDIYTEKNIQDYMTLHNGEVPPFDVGDLKPPHIHCMFRFKDSTPLEHFARALGDERLNNFQKFRRGYKNAFLYLTHTNDLDKTQYKDFEVIANFDYATFKYNVLNHKTKSQLAQDKANQVFRLIMDGVIKRYNLTDYIDDGFYRTYKSKINDTFIFRQEKIRRESRGKRDMKVIYITGPSGSGKTQYAIHHCEQFNLDYYVSSSGKDILDGYGGQDAIILDDLRGDSVGLNDLFKLLDNNTDSLVSSRFYNKSILECKLIIITSIMPIEEFYSCFEQFTHEPIEQLKRRCTEYYVLNDDYGKAFVYSPKYRDYIGGVYFKNPISEKFKTMSNNELLEGLKRTLTDVVGFVTDNRDEIIEEVNNLKFLSDDISDE